MTGKTLKSDYFFRYFLYYMTLVQPPCFVTGFVSLLCFLPFTRPFSTPSKMVKPPTSIPLSNSDNLEQEWEEAHNNFIEFEDYEARLHRLRGELPPLDILNNRDLLSKIRLMERRKRKWLARMHGLTRLIEKRA